MTSSEKETSAGGDGRVTAAVAAEEKQEAVAARVNRRQAEQAAAIARARDRQDAVAARVNRHQAAVAAEVRARQAAAAGRRDVIDRAAQIIPGTVYQVVRVIAFPYQLGRRVLEEMGRRRTGPAGPAAGSV